MSRATIKSEQQTAREATHIPLTRVTTSGNERTRRAKRKSLRSRSKRNGPVGRFAVSTSKNSTMLGNSQVSKTMRATRIASNLNQASRKQLIFRSKAQNRMAISAEKYKQNEFSHKMNAQCASSIYSSVFLSVSMPR